MARHPEHIDSATSQFYINLADNPSLDHTSAETPEDYGYCVFGKVIEGLDVVDKIRNVKTSPKHPPHRDVPMNTVEIISVTRVE